MVRTLGGLDAEALEELRMSERKLDKLANLGKLLAHTADVVVTNLIQTFLVLALDGLSLSEEQ
jgi:hypothetical protein